MDTGLIHSRQLAYFKQINNMMDKYIYNYLMGLGKIPIIKNNRLS